MTTRIFPALRKACCLLFIPIVLSGCSWYFYQAEHVREFFFYDSFDDSNLENRWDPWRDDGGGGTAGDSDFFAAALPGRLEVYGPGHYITSHDTFAGNYAVELEWSVVNGDVETQEFPVALEAHPDFTIRLDAIDTTVGLWLYSKNPDTDETEDRLEMYREGGVFLTEAVLPTAGRERGSLVFEIELQDDRAYVSARVPELGLEIADSVAYTSSEQDHHITIGASGLWSDPRVLDTVIVYPTSSGLGVFE